MTTPYTAPDSEPESVKIGRTEFEVYPPNPEFFDDPKLTSNDEWFFEVHPEIPRPRKRRLRRATKANALKILHRMRERLEQAWTQGRELTDFGYCLTGAIRAEAEAGAALMVTQLLFDEIKPWVRKTCDPEYAINPIMSIQEYNDTFGRRKRDILNLIDRAINRLEQEAA